MLIIPVFKYFVKVLPNTIKKQYILEDGDKLDTNLDLGNLI